MDDEAREAASSMVEIPLAGILVGLFHSHSHSPAESLVGVSSHCIEQVAFISVSGVYSRRENSLASHI